jgi:hypothetical protein
MRPAAHRRRGHPLHRRIRRAPAPGIIGVLGAPRNEGKSLEEIQFERHQVAPSPSATARTVRDAAALGTSPY